MNKTSVVVASLAAMLTAGAVGAADVEKAIKARKGLMQVYAFNLGLVGEMAKGNVEYDAEVAGNAAQNLLALAKMKNGPLWPQGSGNDAPGLAEKTRALPEIWTTYPEVSERQADLTKALEEFVMVAGQDLDGLKGGMNAVGKGCKGCHEKFRAEKE